MPLSHSSALNFSRALALFALATGGFAIGTGEFVIMGLLPDAADDLAVTIPQAGHLISAYALGVVVGAPILAVAGARLRQQRFLLWLMAAYVLGNFASVIAPTYESMLAARFVTGFPHGAFFGVASLVAASMAEPHRRAQCVAMVLLGLTVATLVGVPLAAAAGQYLGWRAAYAIVTVLSALALLMVLRFVPNANNNRTESPLVELGALRNKQVLLTLAVAAIGTGGSFTVISYIKPTMMNMARTPEGFIPVILAVLGVGMVVGNIVGARLTDYSLEGTIGGVLLWAILWLGLFSLTAHSTLLGTINLFFIGTLSTMGPALQVRLMDVAGNAQTLAAALNHSAFNMANALGAILGGLSIDLGLGWSSTGWVGAILAVFGFIIFLWAKHDAKKSGA